MRPYEETIRVHSGAGSRHEPVCGSEQGQDPEKGADCFVETTPKGCAGSEYLNIGPAFYPGMDLDPGRYHVEVSADGFEKEDRWVVLSEGEDETLSIRLTAVQPVSGGKESNSLGMDFAYIPPGSFMMGSPSGEADRYDNETQHRVTLSRGYYLQTTEVTQGQWEKVMGSRPWSGKEYVRENPNNPAVYVSWEDTQSVYSIG